MVDFVCLQEKVVTRIIENNRIRLFGIDILLKRSINRAKLSIFT